jgi:hypothetical protein
MKRYMTMAMIAGALILGSSLLQASIRAGAPKQQRAVVEFNEPVKLLNVILKGEYLFVHDDEKMAQGLDCTYIYQHSGGKQGKLVVSFHCIPVERTKSDAFTVLLSGYDAATGLPEVTEYRFPGETEGHKVPLANAK